MAIIIALRDGGKRIRSIRVTFSYLLSLRPGLGCMKRKKEKVKKKKKTLKSNRVIC